MELPAYHVPAWGNVLRATWERGWSFIKRAGTVILAATIILWFLQGFGFENGAFTMVEDQDNSILAIVASAISWIFIPQGFGNWRATVASISGLIAKENVVGTFGVLYHYADELSDNGDEIWPEVAASFTAISAYSFMIFNLLCAPCFAAMGAIKREMNNGKWTSHLFKGTVAENLRMAAPMADDNALWAVLKQVRLADFLRSENGLDTQLNEGGSNLSGGQRQRLALARALLHDSPVYIFDEATSNIDVESENDIMAQIQALAGKKTVTLISTAWPTLRRRTTSTCWTMAAWWNRVPTKPCWRRAAPTPACGPSSKNWKITERRKHPMPENKKKTRGNLAVMGCLVGLVKPLAPVMVAAVLLGVAGFLCAIFITVLGTYALLDSILPSPLAGLGTAFACILVFALLRGVLRYAEQASNHYIAFKLLALIRDKVFGALRRLTPAKLEGRDRGDRSP